VASGKSSVGKAAAIELGLRFLDTGIMYRAVTWLVLHTGVPVTDHATIGRLAQECSMNVGDAERQDGAINIDGQWLESELSTAAVDRNVSAVSAMSKVRAALVEQQRTIASGGGIVMVGRDIGSVVLPDADVKIYIDAFPEERARRRFEQQRESGGSADYQQVLSDTLRRDKLDSERSDSPLVIANGAVVINTDGIDMAQSVGAVVAAIRAAANHL
jgi:cytidylate kinase